MTMLEDYWLPRREGNRGTEITTLPGGQNLGELTDVQYFQKKLYRALHVPESRLQVETSYNIGRSTEIQRDEVKFTKFINRLRGKFSQLFLKSLEKQLALKGLMNVDEFKEISQDIKFDFAIDNYFSELKNIDITRERVSVLRDLDDYAGRYVSHKWVRKNILRQSEEEIEKEDAEMGEEMNDPRFATPQAQPEGESEPSQPSNDQGDETSQ
jgi:hypothetical protein